MLLLFFLLLGGEIKVQRVKDFCLRPHSSDSTQGWYSNSEPSDPKAPVLTSEDSPFQPPSSLHYSTTEAFVEEQPETQEVQVTLPKVTERVGAMVRP